MRGSLRFRLPALFLLGILVSGVLSAVIALQLFQSYGRSQSVAELRREARGLSEVYALAALQAVDEGGTAPTALAAALERATGDRVFYVGSSPFPGQQTGLTRIPESAIPESLRSFESRGTFEFTPPGEQARYLAAVEPLRLEPGTEPFGLILVGKPRSKLTGPRLPLIERLAAAFAIGAIAAGLLGWWLSRTITVPLAALSRASGEIASGNYAIDLPETEGEDEVADLSRRFGTMAARLAATEERERQFLMSVSHELRTPLTAIRGHVDALRDGLIDDPELVHASLDVVAGEAGRLERLVGDVLDLAKLRAHRFTVQAEEVDLGRLLEQAHSAFTEAARAHTIDLALHIDGTSPTIVSDGDRILQIVSNLLRNAIAWTPEGGRVDLTLDNTDGIVIGVADTGPGILPEQRDAVFRPFVSGDAQGTGLGLPIALELARALGGRLDLQSTVGVGSRFQFRLPAA